MQGEECEGQGRQEEGRKRRGVEELKSKGRAEIEGRTRKVKMKLKGDRKCV